MVPPDSHRVSRVRQYSGTTTRSRIGFVYGALTLFRRPSQTFRLPLRFLTAHKTGRSCTCGPTTPTARTLPGIDARRFGLIPVRSPLLGESLLMSLPPPTEMFQFSGLSPLPLWVQSKGDRPSRLSGLPIGRSTGRRLCAPHRGLSQLVTSFIGFLCQGIHRTLLTSCLCLHSFANNKQRHLRYIRCSVAGIHTCCAIF